MSHTGSNFSEVWPQLCVFWHHAQMQVKQQIWLLSEQFSVKRISVYFKDVSGNITMKQHMEVSQIRPYCFADAYKSFQIFPTATKQLWRTVSKSTMVVVERKDFYLPPQFVLGLIHSLSWPGLKGTIAMS